VLEDIFLPKMGLPVYCFGRNISSSTPTVTGTPSFAST
jgi:hypothetical protein